MHIAGVNCDSSEKGRSEWAEIVGRVASGYRGYEEWDDMLWSFDCITVLGCRYDLYHDS